jgi:hypothetical protein
MSRRHLAADGNACSEKQRLSEVNLWVSHCSLRTGSLLRHAVRLTHLVVALSPAVLYAQGGPPMLTDDPGTPGNGNWEINVAYLQERNSLEQLSSFPHVDVNYGLGESIQVKFETGWVFANFSDSGSRSGLDDSLIGLKWRFLDQSKAGLNISIYPQVTVENSTGSVARGIAPPGPSLLLPVEVSRDFGKLQVVGEVGYEVMRSAENEWVLGILGALAVSERFELLSEVHITGSKLFSESDVILNFGFRQELTPYLRLLASAGTGLNNGPNRTSFVAYLGIQIVLGEEKH